MEKPSFVDQRRAAVGTFLAAHAASLARQGAIVPTWRRRGPYFLLTCRDEAGRQRSVYLGPRGPIVDETRNALRRLQSPRRQRREIEEPAGRWGGNSRCPVACSMPSWRRSGSRAREAKSAAGAAGPPPP